MELFPPEREENVGQNQIKKKTEEAG